jgi:hypothetical protein
MRCTGGRVRIAPNLLNEDGTASMATALMMSHHAFRRDLARFSRALQQIDAGDDSRIPALRDEWAWFRGGLHGHHHAEDTGIFPSLATEHPALVPTLDRLSADHRHIDPLLERGDLAFAELPDTTHAKHVIADLLGLLHDHLAIEEAEIVPYLRSAFSFPPPANEEEAAMYAQGFAWSSHGIAPEVLTRVDAMVPKSIASRLPAARAAFAERCVRVWGTAAAGAATTPIPTV